jgi:hypothetical protein
LEYLVAALATYRISVLLAFDYGPLEILERFRQWLGVDYDSEGNRYSETELGQLIMCVYCNSVWVGVAVTVLIHVFSWWAYVLLPFALSGVAVLLASLSENEHSR